MSVKDQLPGIEKSSEDLRTRLDVLLTAIESEEDSVKRNVYVAEIERIKEMLDSWLNKEVGALSSSLELIKDPKTGDFFVEINGKRLPYPPRPKDGVTWAQYRDRVRKARESSKDIPVADLKDYINDYLGEYTKHSLLTSSMLRELELAIYKKIIAKLKLGNQISRVERKKKTADFFASYEIVYFDSVSRYVAPGMEHVAKLESKWRFLIKMESKFTVTD